MITSRKTLTAFLRQPSRVLTILCLLFGFVGGLFYRHHTAHSRATKQQALTGTLGEAVSALRYRVNEVKNTSGGKAIEAVNPAQNMRARFTDNAVQVQSSSACQTPWELGLRLKRVGYGTQLRDVQPGVLQAQDNRVEVKRDTITEWYLNKPEGIEQGFTLHTRPTIAPSTSEELRVVMELSDGWNVTTERDNQAITLQKGGANLRYDKLQTLDATGRELESRMEVRGNELALIVKDANAVWPITIDPTLTQQTQFIANNGAAFDHFGTAVSISDDTAVVGVPDFDVNATTNSGAAFIFVRNGATWSQQAQLTASDAASNDNFGAAVAISGDTIVIGAYTDDNGLLSDQGSAYVFTRSGTTWSQQTKLNASTGAANDWFGYSVAINAETIMVGAPLDDDGSTFNQGAAYIFTRSGTAWSQQQQFIASDAADSDNFGFAVALQGQTAVVGATADDVNGASDQGSAYVFVRNGATWSQQQQLIASDGSSADLLGYAVAISGETVTIGAPRDDVNSNVDQGSAYVFVRSGVTWNQQSKLTASDGAGGDTFGHTIAINNEMVVAGAPNDDVSGKPDQGSAYVFVRNGSSWSQQQQMIASDGASNDNAGSTVAISGFTTLIGAPNDDVNGNNDQGSTYVFSPTCPTMTLSPTTLANGTQNLTYSTTTISSSAGTAPLNFAIITGALPTGLTLSSSGLLSGTPTVAGNFNFTVKVTDANLCTGTRAYSLAIATCAPPTVSTPPTHQSSAVGSSASFLATASGTPPTVQWQVSTDGNIWNNIDGATNPTLSSTNLSITMHGNQYRAVFTNACGTVTSIAATLTVNPLTPTVALSSSANSAVYGQNVTLSANVTTINNVAPTGSIIFKTGATTLGTATLSNGQASLSLNNLSAAVHSITAEYSGDTNYVSGASGALALTINKALLTVTAENKAKVYGATNPALTASITGFVSGESASVVTGVADLTTTAMANNVVGEYPITASLGTLAASNYSFTFVAAKLTIGKATLTVSAEDKSRLFGATNPELTATITGFVNGDLLSAINGAASLTTSATTNSGVGTYPIIASVGTLTATNYDFTFINAMLTITAQTLTVTAQSQNRTYGAANPTLTVQYAGFVNGDSESVLTGAAEIATTATTTSNVGTYPITVRQGSLQSGNYALAFIDGTLTIGKAALTVIATDATRSYGAPNPTLTGILSGVQNDDRITASFVTSANVNSIANAYPITSTLHDPDNKLGNYEVKQTNATLTITAAALTITAENASRLYGAANPAFTSRFSGFVNNENEGALGGAVQFRTTATANSAVGEYPITVGGFTSSNYAINYVNGTLAIRKATLTVTAENKTKSYGAANPALTATMAGYVNGESANVVSGTASLTTPATQSSGAGSYAITTALGTLVATNYEFAFEPGTLTIGKAALTVTAANKIKVFGASLPELTYSISGYFNGDGASAVTGVPEVNTTAIATSNVGTYPIRLSLGSLAAASYDFNFVNAELTIAPATTAVTVVSNAPSSLFAQPVTFTAMVNVVAPGAGLPNGSITFKDGAKIIGTATLTNGQGAMTTSVLETGTHSITAEYRGSENFSAAVSPSITQTVSKSPALVTLGSSFDAVRYGQAVTLNASVSGGGATPTGKVRFLQGTTLLGTVALANGAASLTINTLPVAMHAITAIYDGDEKNEGGTSRAFTLTVNKAAQPLSISSSANPVGWKQFVTLAAGINSAGNGLTPPSGTIVFKNGATVLGTSALSRLGRASIATNTLPPGGHSITAEFSGDSNYEVNTATALSQTISKGETAIRPSLSARTATFGQPVIFSAQIHGQNGAPTGNIEIYDGAQLLSTEPLNNGFVSYTLTSLTDGEHMLKAVYKGDEQFASSTSSLVPLTVSPFCTWTPATNSAVFDLKGGAGFIPVNARGDCFWSAFTNDRWITILDYGPEVGAVSFSVAPLTEGTARKGTITVAGHRITILQAKPATTVSGASYTREGLAPDTIASVFGEELAPATEPSQSLPLPTTLGGVQVKITDSKGIEHIAPLFYVAPLQINYLVPAEVALGPALVTIQTPASEITGGGMIEVTPVTPGLFTANANGSGVAAAVVQRVLVDNSQRYEQIAQFDPAQNKVVSVPIDFGEEGEEVYLVLFGTGLRNRLALATVRATVGTQDIEILYAGAQGGYVGLDQLNLKLPRTLAGKGEVDLQLFIEGRPANTVRINLK